MASTFKSDLDSLDVDYSNNVFTAYNNAKQQLTQVRTANLQGADRALPDDLTQKLDSTNAEFVAGKEKLANELKPKREELNKKHLTYTLIKLALIIVGILLVFTPVMAFGFILVLAGIICHFVFKSMEEKPAAELAAQWHNFFAHYTAVFGHKESLHAPATGLYKEVDELFLKSLDDQTRGFEMQNRQMQKQMEAQNEQHQQAMAMQAAQMEAMQQMIKEQRTSNAISLLKK